VVCMVDGIVCVEGDLHEGDQVVVAGHAFLLDGDAVEVVP
jgi:predicted ribosome-associated RNA-binding protein Tma20